MASDWLRRCRGEGITIDGPSAIVTFLDERSHRVRVDDEADHVRLSAVVVQAAAASRLVGLLEEAWTRNRGTRLANFFVDDRGRVMAEARLPLAGLTQAELVFRVRVLAEECDRFEQKLTGRDAE